MILLAPEEIDFAALPSLPLAARLRLPNISAIYFVLTDKDYLLYIGQTKSLCLRWQNHHRVAKFQEWSDVRIAWIPIDDHRALPVLERAYIVYFQPLLNNPYIRTPSFGGRKEATSIRLTPEATSLLSRLSEALGLSQAGVLETIIRDKAKAEGVVAAARQRGASRLPR